METSLLETCLQSLRDEVQGVVALDLPDASQDEVDAGEVSDLVAAFGARLSGALTLLVQLHSGVGSGLGGDELDGEFDADFDQVRPSLSEVAFFVSLELRHYGGWLLDQAGPLDIDTLLARCERLKRHMIAALTDVEVQLCAALGVGSTLSGLREDELGRARASRRAYTRFIAVIDVLRAADAAGPRSRYPSLLATSCAALTELVDDPTFSSLRRADRELLEGLHDRLLLWSGRAIADELEARRLWRELQACVVTLDEIQRRRILIEHDADSASELLWSAQLEASLAAGDPRLDELGSRSPALAEALADGNPAEIGRELERVYDALALALGRPSLAARRCAAKVELLIAR
jgi:hypothetical protein